MLGSAIFTKTNYCALFFDYPALDLGARGKGLALQSCLMFTLLLLSLPSAPSQFVASFQSQVACPHLCQQRSCVCPSSSLAGRQVTQSTEVCSRLTLSDTGWYSSSILQSGRGITLRAERQTRPKISAVSASTDTNAHPTSEDF